jgi:predicted RND superfamily exporter protein
MKPSFIESLIHRYISFNLKYWPLMLALSVVLMAVGAWFGKSIGLNSDLRALLPQSADSVVNMDLIREKSGSTHDLKLVLFGGSLEKRIEAAFAFENHLKEKHPDFTRAVRIRTPKEFFENHKFKLIPQPSLDAILSKIERERKENAAFTDPLGLEATQEQTEKPIPQLSEEDEKKEIDQAKNFLDRLENMREFYVTEDGAYLSLRILPAAANFSIESNRRLFNQFEQMVSDFQFSSFDPEIKTEIYGTIISHIHRFDSIIRDVQFGGIGIALILLVVALYFQSIWALVATVPPLVTGLAIGMGMVRLAEGSLNTIAIFLVLVVFGLGIEFGIHLWARFLQEYSKAKNVADALHETWRTTGRATLTSSTALLCGFAILAISTFQGFAQFGRVAVLLIVSAAGSFVLFMPAWILLTERFAAKSLLQYKARAAKTLAALFVGFCFHSKLAPVLRWGSLVLGLVGVVVAALYFRFDYGFQETYKSVQRGSSQIFISEMYPERLTPSAVALLPDLNSASQFLEYYEANKSAYPEIELATGLATFFPTDQTERIEKLQVIADELEPEWIDRFEDESIREALRELKLTAYDQTPLALKDVPPETQETFVAADGSGDQIVYLFDHPSMPDGRKAMRFKENVERLVQESGASLKFSGNEIIFADIVSRVVREGPWLIIGMFILVFLVCFLDFRTLPYALFTMAPVVAGFVYTAFVMVMAGKVINFFNMVALASLGAMVVDNSIHLFHRFLEVKDRLGVEEGAKEALKKVGPTVLICTITSICGYGGMAFANHNGISSLGWVAITGLICCFISAVLFFPVWLSQLKARMFRG